MMKMKRWTSDDADDGLVRTMSNRCCGDLVSDV